MKNMLSRIHVLFIFLISLLVFAKTEAQSITTMGTDFWLTFMYAADAYVPSVNVSVRISSANNCYATLSNPNTGWSTSVSINPNDVTQISVPISQAQTSLSGEITNTGLHLTSTDTVSVFAALNGTNDYDVANIIPSHLLRNEYMIQSYPSDRHGAEFAIVATSSNTWVDIILTTSVTTGAVAGDTISVYLPNAGNVYQLKTNSIGDFSGTRIIARNCKKIAVFHGDACIYIPSYYYGQTCDHVVEQALPTVYWGQEFFIVPTTAVLNDRAKITALNDSCIVLKNGTQLSNALSAGESIEFEVLRNEPALWITTSTPASVNVYYASTGNGTGDPSMLTINSVEQMVKQVTFSCFNTVNTQEHHVTIVTKTSDVSLLRLDGVPVNQFTVSQYNNEYSYKTITVSHGSHTLSALGGSGFNAYAYGLGFHESYAYSVGSSLRDLSNRLYVEGHFATEDVVFDFCKGDTVHMNVVCDANPVSVLWFYGDSSVSFGHDVSHIYNPGIYNVMVIVPYYASSCNDGVDDTLRAQIRVLDFDTTYLQVAECRESYHWYDSTYTTPGRYTHLLTNTRGCDSLLVLDLSFYDDSDTTYLHVAECGESYQWYDSTYTTPGIYTHLLSNTRGCDSLLVMDLSFHENSYHYTPYEGCDSLTIDDNVFFSDDTLTIGVYNNQWGCDSFEVAQIHIYHSVETLLEASIYEGDTLNWIDGNSYYYETESPSILYNTVHGCDSIIRLHLSIIPTPGLPGVDSSCIWVPNAFTPELSSNNVFKIITNDIVEAHVWIYTRWGIYLADFDGLSACWDGSYKGIPCKQEAYVYLIEYITKDKPQYKQKKKGTVLLLR